VSAADAPHALVTGAAGFIGSHLVEALLAAGTRVVGVDAFDDFYDPRLKRENLRQALRHPSFTLEECDLGDADAAAALARRHAPDVVVHLAGMPGVRRSLVEPARYVRANVLATQHVLDAFARERRIPLVYAGSSSAYGNDTPVPFAEDAACGMPESPYAATKRAGELLCVAAAHAFEAPVTIVRLFTVYGPRQRPDLAIRRFATAMLAGEEITVFGDGTMARDFTHVDDIVRGIGAACTERAGLRIVNLGNSSPVTVNELVARLGEALGVTPRVRNVPRPPGEMNVTFADVRRARERWGWRPQVALTDGLADFARWLRAPGYTLV
jgi:UDP-glucuronate 4-epimerase